MWQSSETALQECRGKRGENNKREHDRNSGQRSKGILTKFRSSQRKN